MIWKKIGIVAVREEENTKRSSAKTVNFENVVACTVTTDFAVKNLKRYLNSRWPVIPRKITDGKILKKKNENYI